MPPKTHMGGVGAMKPEFIDMGMAIIPTKRIGFIQKIIRTKEIESWWWNQTIVISTEYGLWIDDLGEDDVSYSDASEWELFYASEALCDHYYDHAAEILTGINNEPTSTIQENIDGKNTDVAD